MRKILTTLSLALFSFLINAQDIDMSLMKGIKIRNIGPAGMSGRVTAIDAVHANPDIIYIGTASGGVWKSLGGGVTWIPVFEKEAVASVGALAIDQSNPDVIWIGTGEGNPRNSATSGAGVYRTLDGGVTWQLMGLEGTRNIHRVIVDPRNSNMVYVGAQGSAWGESADRGVYKTIDGGKTWKKILYTNSKTGIGELIMDPNNPNKLFAAMWEFRRWPWFFKSGGEGSALHVTYDGGETWKKLSSDDGLPEGELGRMGLAISKSNSKVVYALIESKKNALYKSEDGGVKWKKVQDKQIGGRPFYYAEIAADPLNENRLYNIYSEVGLSEDGGKTFSTLLGWNPTRVHGDYHAIWIHPTDPSLVIIGNDGGLAISRDRAKTFRFVENLPVGQFYHISTDNQVPYNIYGGMQDNGSWIGPSNSLRNGGLRNSYWDEIAFGDGFDVVPDRSNPRYAFGMWQGGNVLYIDLETGESQYIKPVHPEGKNLRFNWNAAIAQDRTNPDVIYYGSQYVHKSIDKGQNWTIISPDLTTNDPAKQKSNESGGLTMDASGAENFTTILAISPSPMDDQVIWVSTDDGNIQLTKDGGKTWTNLNSRIKGLKSGAWMPQIKASKYNAGEAVLVVNDYRRDDWTPWLYRTKDYGKSWERLIDEQDVSGYVLSFVQDPVEPNLMFAGTEFGLYVSFNAGQSWNQWKEGYPTVSTYDLEIQEEFGDLVIGTFGRSIWVLDDIRPLRALAKESTSLLEKNIHVYEVADAYLWSRKEAAGTRFQGDAIYKGDDKANGALLTYSLKKTSKQDTTIKSDTVWVKVFDAENNEIRKAYTIGKQGMNRYNWDMCQKGYRSTSTAKPDKEIQDVSGRWVLPGEYKVQFKYGNDSMVTNVLIKKDPRIEITKETMAKNAQTLDQINKYRMLATTAIDQLNGAKKSIDLTLAAMKRQDVTNDEVSKQSKVLKEKIKSLKELINEKEDLQGFIDGGKLISGQLWTASYYSQLYSRNNTSQEMVANQLKTQLNGVLAQTNEFFETEWATFEKDVNALNLSLFQSYEKLEID
ncbi:WD40/YVTN/BNR-like repeat-containing protein [Reichenbachiella sp.]|uniref:WD40/YVTN/BNR-like repeat-containing protein n=1 Tax=Reichenbachiella sp. TaxID=2184521 RepID=UPI003B5A711C